MDVTSGGELYVVGETKSSDLDVFERSAAYWQDELANGYGDGHSNAFVFSLDSDLEKKWITYFGGYASTSSPISIDIPWGITVSSDDLSMFMSGETSNDEYFPLWMLGTVHIGSLICCCCCCSNLTVLGMRSSGIVMHSYVSSI